MFKRVCIFFVVLVGLIVSYFVVVMFGVVILG